MTKPGKRKSPRISSVQNKRRDSTSHPEPDNVGSMIIPDVACSISAATTIQSNAPRSGKNNSFGSISCKTKVQGGKCNTVIRPTPEECEYAVTMLGKIHPDVLTSTSEIKNMRNAKQASASQQKHGSKQSVQDIKSEEDNNFQASSCGKQQTVMDGVISTMLSQNTTAANSTRAFANLKKAFPSWDTVADLETTEPIETAVRIAGLAKIRAQRILTICNTLKEERGGRVSLEYLRDYTSQQVKDELLRFPGLGVKTISCVLMFTLGREDEFPVDTHVLRWVFASSDWRYEVSVWIRITNYYPPRQPHMHVCSFCSAFLMMMMMMSSSSRTRISQQNKWVPSSFKRDEAYEYLNQIVPDHLKLDLHCLLVQHGRECHRCAARGKPQFPPKDGSKIKCPLANLSAIAAGDFTALKEEARKGIKIKFDPTPKVTIKLEKWNWANFKICSYSVFMWGIREGQGFMYDNSSWLPANKNKNSLKR